MKILVENETNLSKYIFDDSKAVNLKLNCIEVGDPLELIISDLNFNNSTLYENITDIPQDWIGNKYIFDGVEWILNPDWSLPE